LRGTLFGKTWIRASVQTDVMELDALTICSLALETMKLVRLWSCWSIIVSTALRTQYRRVSNICITYIPDPLSGQTDPSALLDQVNSYFSNFCGNLKNEMCRARSCCSECTDEFNVYFECTATIASSYIRESVEEFQGALAAILAGNTEEEGGEETEFGATCNLSDHTCDGGGGDRITGSDSGASSEAIGLVVASTALVAALIMV